MGVSPAIFSYYSHSFEQHLFTFFFFTLTHTRHPPCHKKRPSTNLIPSSQTPMYPFFSSILFFYLNDNLFFCTKKVSKNFFLIKNLNGSQKKKKKKKKKS